MNEEMKEMMEELQEFVHKGQKLIHKAQQKLGQRRGYSNNYGGGGYNSNYGGGGYNQNMGQMHGSFDINGGMNPMGGGMGQMGGQMGFYPQDPTQVPGSMFFDPRYM